MRPTCKNIVLARVVGSMTEFKQIIGRGTRVRDDYGKLWFNIIDYTGSATQLFADPDFDGEPAFISEEEIDAAGKTIKEKIIDDGLPHTGRARIRDRSSSKSRRPLSAGNIISMKVMSRSRHISFTNSIPTGNNCAF